jgi:hypothetical protein
VDAKQRLFDNLIRPQQSEWGIVRPSALAVFSSCPSTPAYLWAWKRAKAMLELS